MEANDAMQLDQRVPEPELMEDPDQAAAYSGADFAEAHDSLVNDLVGRFPDLRSHACRIVDLGCGPADVTVRLALALPAATVVGVDAGPVMLALGEQRVRRVGLEDRVSFVRARLSPTLSNGLEPFDVVVANSVLHHLRDPDDLWTAVAALGRGGAAVHVADLVRPMDTAAVDALVTRYASSEPLVLREDFARSLAAAYRPEEIVAQLDRAGLGAHLQIEVVSDRHLVVWGRLPV